MLVHVVQSVLLAKTVTMVDLVWMVNVVNVVTMV